MEGTQKIIPVTQAKKELLEIVKEMAEEGITVAVAKNGVPVSVLMSADLYGGLLETIGRGEGTPLFSCVYFLNQFKVVSVSDGFASVGRSSCGRRADSKQSRYRNRRHA